MKNQRHQAILAPFNCMVSQVARTATQSVYFRRTLSGNNLGDWLTHALYVVLEDDLQHPADRNLQFHPFLLQACMDYARAWGDYRYALSWSACAYL